MNQAINKIRYYIKKEEWHNYLVILPTTFLVQKFINSLFDEEFAGALYPKIFTFDQFVEEVLINSNNVHYISDITKVEILRDVISKEQLAGNLRYFKGPIRYGIINFIAEAISELKQHGITAQSFGEVAKLTNTPRIIDLAIIYKCYEDVLKANKIGDREDRFIDVLYKIKNDEVPFLKYVEYVYTDWFIDNTPIQQLIFKALQDKISAAELNLGIYAQTKLDNLRLNYLHPNDKHIANLIYSNKNDYALQPRVTICNERGKEDEVRKILHEVIRLLDSGINPSDIAITARNTQEYQDLLIKWFAKIDAPLQLEIKKPLLSSQVVKAIMMWFDLAHHQDKPFNLSILINNHYLVDVIDNKNVVLKWCQSKGEHTMAKWISLWHDDQSKLVPSLGEQSYGKVLNILENVLDMWSSLPEKGLVQDITTAIINNLDNLNIQTRMQVFLNDVTLEERIKLSYRENQALSSYRDLISNLKQAGVNSTRIVSLAGMLNNINNHMANLTYSESKNYQNGIAVLAPTELRGLKFHTVFVLGMEQNQFPKVVVQNPILKDSDRINLGKHFYLPLSHEIYEREKLLFYLVLQACDKELFLTYAGTDEEGQTNLASLFIEDVLSFIGDDEAPEPYLPALTEQVLSPQLFHLLEVESHRNSPSFTIYEGCFNDELLVNMMREKTMQKTFSISSLNDYAKCPMKYFMVAELGLGDQIDIKEGISKPELGAIKHEVLAQVLAMSKNIDDNKLPTLVAKVLDEVCARRGLVGEEYPHLWLWELEKRNIIESVTGLIRFEINRGTLTPTLFEWRFGFEEPFYLEINERKVFFRGVIDRIDTDGENHFAVYDYKERVSVARKDIEGARELQLPIYVMAVERLLGEVIGTSYLEIKEQKPKHHFYKQGYKDKLGFGTVRTGELDQGQWEKWLEQINLEVGNYVNNICSGRFPNLPHSCNYCHLIDICLYKPSRVRLKSPGGFGGGIYEVN